MPMMISEFTRSMPEVWCNCRHYAGSSSWDFLFDWTAQKQTSPRQHQATSGSQTAPAIGLPAADVPDVGCGPTPAARLSYHQAARKLTSRLSLGARSVGRSFGREALLRTLIPPEQRTIV